MAERFIVELEHVGDREAATLALRLALKRLLRDHKLRCVKVSPGDSHVTAAIQRQHELDRKAASIPVAHRIENPLP